MIYFYILMSTILSSSNLLPCLEGIQKKILPEPCGTIRMEGNLEVAWCNTLMPDHSRVGSTSLPLIYQDQILMALSLGENPGENQKIVFFDKYNGELIRELSIAKDVRTIYNMYIQEDLLIIEYTASGIECIDLESLNSIWRYEPTGKNANSEIHLFEEYVYVPILHGDKPYIDSTSIIKIEIQTGEAQLITTVTREECGGGSPHINNVKVERMDNGDSMIYFAVDIIRAEGGGHFDLWSFSEKKSTYPWKIENLDRIIIQYHPAVIYKDWLTVIGQKVYTIDKKSGEILGKQEVDGNHRMTAPYLAGDKIYAKSAQKNLYCIDAKSGEIVWENSNPGTISQNKLNHFEDVLYYSGFENALFAIDMKTGKQIFREKSPFELGYFNIGGQVIDSDAKMIYISDGYRVMALSI